MLKKVKTFLKWAGNKSSIKHEIISKIGNPKRLIEPFCGSCAIALNVDAKEYLLSDINSDLINTYKMLIQESDFIAFAESFFTPENNTKERFYELRELFNTTSDIKLKSALFIYLNRHAYNGLCRYNKDGKFNVPFGRYKRVYFPEQEMVYFRAKLKNATFLCADFRDVMKMAQDGDIIYCDPPYVPLSETASFTNYASSGFSLKDQQDLAYLALELSKKGIRVIISNHDTTITQNLYSKAVCESLSVQRYISCKERKKASEILAVYHG